MAEATRIPHRLSPEADTIVRKYAKSRGVELGEAVDKLIGIADSRVGALERYALGREAKPRPKKAKKRSS
jgi:hypothetical protein